MQTQLYNYILNPEDSIANFNLAIEYEKQNMYAPATSFLLKCIENTNDDMLIYECLIKLFLCYERLQNRDFTAEHFLKRAIILKPNIPYAYWLLSRFYENKQNYVDAYLYSSLGLNCDNVDSYEFRSISPYPGKYALIFHKAVASWFYGKPDECRQLFRNILAYYEDINSEYMDIIQYNITRLGNGKYFKFTHNDVDKIRFKFDGIQLIPENYSQVFQDIFVLTLLNGKTNGTYLEVGSAHAFHNSNTALLEKIFHWDGVGIELNKDLVDEHLVHRKNKIYNTNALNVNYTNLLKKHFPNNTIIDYLQLDIEPSKNTFEALLAIPFDKYKFRIITYEHDHYVDLTQSYRTKSRNYLKSIGYELLINDVAADDSSSFEDWWVKPELICPNILQKFRSLSLNDETNNISKIIYDI